MNIICPNNRRFLVIFNKLNSKLNMEVYTQSKEQGEAKKRMASEIEKLFEDSKGMDKLEFASALIAIFDHYTEIEFSERKRFANAILKQMK